MKKYKNLLFSLTSIIIAFVLIFSFNLIGTGFLFIFYMFIIFGIFFASISNKKKESPLAGNIMLIIGILSLFYPFLELPIAFVLSSILFNLTH